MKLHRRPRNRPTTKLLICLLGLLLPTLVAGCPEFRNQIIDATETATRNMLLSDQEPQATVEAAIREIAAAALGLFFDQFRTETTRF